MQKYTLITCHINADWDALAAIIAASKLYPNSLLVYPGSMEKELNAYFNDFINVFYSFVQIKEIDPEDIERIVIVDTCQASRVAHIEKFLQKDGIEVHIYDHHQKTNDCINSTLHKYKAYGSTCSILVQELKKQKIEISSQDATIIGAGIYEDTGSFKYSSTTKQDFNAAAWLYKRGMDVEAISALLKNNLTSTHIKVLHDLLANANMHALGNNCLTISQASADHFIGDFAVIVQRFMEMEVCDVLFAIGILADKIQVVARSRISNIDVGKVCKVLGGGGHNFAAAASVKSMPLAEIKEVIFREIYAQMNPNRTAQDLMSSPARGIEENMSIHDAKIVMNRYGLKASPVFTDNTLNSVGILDEQTASRAVSHGLGDMPVRIYMQPYPSLANFETPLQEIMDIIIGEKQRLVPVIDEKNNTVGVVTRTDIINMFVHDNGNIPLPKTERKKEYSLNRALQNRLPRYLNNVLKVASELADKFEVPVYAVGGFVRDVLLARPSADLDDLDLVVEGDGIDFARELSKKLKGRVREHHTFLTAIVIFNDADGVERRVDVATARLEYYLYPAALPTVELSSIKMDLFRRDFTINAMAIRLNSDKYSILVDFFGGQEDIQRKKIRVLHSLSFVEDPTRIIRAIRFAVRYKFQLDEQAIRLIKNSLELKMIDKLSGSRIMHELSIIFNEKNALACIEEMDRLNILKAISPMFELTEAKHELLSKVKKVLEWYQLLYLTEKIDLQTIYLLAFASKRSITETKKMLDRLYLPDTFKQEYLALREQIGKALPLVTAWKRKKNRKISELCTILEKIPLNGLLYLMARSPAKDGDRNISLYINRWRLIEADIRGADLIKLGFIPSPIFSKVLHKVRCAKLDSEVNDKQEQIELAKKIYYELTKSVSFK